MTSSALRSSLLDAQASQLSWRVIVEAMSVRIDQIAARYDADQLSPRR